VAVEPLLAIESGTVLIVAALIAIPVAAIAFARGAGSALEEVGKGPFAIEQEFPAAGTGPVAPVTKAVREAEIRQMLEARSFRAEARGEKPIDVESELDKLLASERDSTSLAGDKALRAEVRDLVIARNERRRRAGKKPLDVEKEIDRQLAELENLGQ
jgi:hypothetical protein